jgi:biopolymer transport protein ExbB
LAVVACAASCVFELGDVVEPAAGGGGTGGTGGEGGSEPTAERTRIDVDASALTSSHPDFPLLVVLGPSNVSYALAGDDGANIRFYAEDGTTLLAHEIEQWTPGGTSHVWVHLPSVGGEATSVVWLHAGEPSPPATLPPTDVWSAYLAVYHLADAPPAEVTDAAAGARHGTPVMLTESDRVEGRLGPGYRFAGVSGPSPHVALGGDEAFFVPPNGVLTAELWFQRAGATAAGSMLALEGCCLGWGVSLLPPPPLIFRSVVGVGNCCSGSDDYAYAQFTMPGGDADTGWHHVVTVMDRAAGATTVYLDGVEVYTELISASAATGQGELMIGASYDGSSGFEGVLDEVRLSQRALPSDWVAFQYATWDGSAVAVGEPEPIP